MRKRLLAAVGVLAVAAAAGTTFAVAHGGDGTQLHACVANASGDMRLVAPTQACRANERPVDWNVKGEEGAAGPVGPQGPAGPAGPKGDPGSAGGGGAASEPSTAKVGSVKIVGQIQGTFYGDSAGWIDVLSFSHEVVSPRDAASGLPTGKRQHKPFTIVKHIDKASIQLFSALTRNETLTRVEFDLVPRAGGAPYAKVELINASVASRHTADAGKTTHHELETVSFTYQKIIWTFLDGGIVAEDDWETPVA